MGLVIHSFLGHFSPSTDFFIIFHDISNRFFKYVPLNIRGEILCKKRRARQ